MKSERRAETNGLSTAALIFSILSVLFGWLWPLGSAFVCLTVTFAFLSRGGRKMGTMAKISLLIAAAGIAAGMAFLVLIFRPYLTSLRMFSPQDLLRMLQNLLRVTGGAR